ncbi:MAG: sulfatase [Pirellulales bacterium]
MRSSMVHSYLAIVLWMVCSANLFAHQRPPNILILMADNWAYPHAGIYGDPVVKTPVFDSLAREGVLFRNSYCLVPSCSPARAAFLSGQAIHRLGDAASLHGRFPKDIPVFTDMLEANGYRVGYSGKGWGPGNWNESGRTRNPAGAVYPSFEEFLKQEDANRPFCFWFSSKNPHVPWTQGQELKEKMSRESVVVPKYLPDVPVVRESILDYYAEVEDFDREAGEHLKLLAAAGHAEDTLVIMCGDNGWQMPHGLAQCYDAGTHVSMVIRGPAGFRRNVQSDEFITFDDMAPTILAAAGCRVSDESSANVTGRSFTGRSLMPILTGVGEWSSREAVFLERERHANVRRDNGSYPVRAVRTKSFLYIRNFEPDRFPTGDPETWFAVGPFGDCDHSPVKSLLLSHRSQAEFSTFFQMNFGKRPSEELYDLRIDPDQTHSVAADANYAADKARLAARLHDWMRRTEDPRFADPHTRIWDNAPYYGPRAKSE